MILLIIIRERHLLPARTNRTLIPLNVLRRLTERLHFSSQDFQSKARPARQALETKKLEVSTHHTFYIGCTLVASPDFGHKLEDI